MANLQLTQEKLDALRSEYRPRRPCALLKYPRPKTKPEYQAIYPWLLPDETDPHFVFCAVCECRLSCKRSDLGKHEGSIKHSENAQRKALPAKANHPEAEGSGSSVMKWEYNEYEEGLLPYGADAADDETEEEEGELDETEEDCEEAEEDEVKAEALETLNDFETEPASKQQRRISETDSQHSGMLDYLPLHVTINELPPSSTTAGSSFPTSSSTAATAAPPCRITIKKVSAPTTPPNAVCQGQEISSKATITPIHTTPSYAARQLQSYQLQPVSPIIPPRDSLELFFDSICATVKSLPPKLATEGKIRVMQLIGELELRALAEQEASAQSSSVPGHQGIDLAGSSAAGVTDAPGSGQQNATVASTTK
ncbi:protein suppressor of variegation 3-7 [Drosophila rhopaloa]|uniref:BESS domain-containing protein n=1 Tax=Drosophila rhopaloa TaxID=1041015 RepID=A0ABM5GXP8_DRORH|nr:protein suppressor of variegation 3-7 [Drosophila rhopaloa]